MGMDVNHGLEFIRLLIENADVLAALDVFSRGFPLLELGSSYGIVNTAFMVRHRGHKLVPWNEYGRRADECGIRLRCDACGSEKRCVLPPDHDPGTPHTFKKSEG
jgi:hypothetical protein